LFLKALGGYLHSTIHSTAARSKSHNQKFQNPELYRQYSAGGINQTNGAPIWNKLFTNPEKTDDLEKAETGNAMVPLNSDSNRSEKVNTK